MNVPFKIVLPSFKIDNQTRDVSISFSTMPIAGEERVATIIDYWLITDHRGKTMRDIPKGKNGYIAQNQHGKKIELVMRGAGFNLSYDSLDVCIHFLLRNGQSVSANYKYKMIGNKFAFSSIDAKKMTAEEQDVMLERLVAADSFDKEATAKKISPTDNTNESNFDNNSFVGYNDEITRFMRAVYKEMYFLKNDGGRKYDITNGCFIMQLQGAFVYIFDLDAELYLADDSPVTVTVGLEKIAGTVLFCENFQIMVALDQIPHLDKTTKIASAKINAEPWKLLEKLNDCLRKININNEIALSLLEDGPYLATNGDEASIVRGQEKAYNQAINSPITVIWGPPGTGKTYTMAKIAAEFLRQGKKVLIVSHSNVSVDNVAKQIYNQVKESPLSHLLEQARILRYGYVRDEELQKNDYIASFKVAMKDSSDKKTIEKLQEECKALKSEFPNDKEIHKKILLINQEIKRINSKHKEREKALVESAQLVATTVSKIYADQLFEDMTYDAVMFDEISMAYVPQIVCAASFASQHLICVGDFRQLSPIVQDEKAKSILGKDLFEYLNISNGFHEIHPHPWLIMLDEQRRMHPEISKFPSRYVYNGLLRDHESVKLRREHIAKTEPFNEPMCLIDLQGTCAFGSKNESNSRFNILSAVFAFATALKSEKSQNSIDCKPEEKVGIITPYAAQTRLIKAMIQDHRESKKTTGISCATVHQFQGSERNVIIFDAVESFPSTRAGWLMSKNEGGAVTRLINVALTRSRGKFIAIANRAFWLKKFDVENMFHSLVKYMGGTSHILDHRNDSLAKYISNNDFGRNIKVYTSTISSNYDVLDDIRSAKYKIMLMLPKGRINADYARSILSEIKLMAQKKVAVTIVHDKAVVLSSEYEDISVPSDKVTMPLLFVDNKVWYGLPILNYVCYEGNVAYPILADIIVRFSGEKTVKMIKSLTEHTNDSTPITGGFGLYVRKNLSCPQCGEPLAMARKNGVFLWCKKCRKSQKLSAQMVNKYLDTTGGECPRCNKSLCAVNGMYGVYIKCSNNHTFKPEEV